MAVIDLFIPHGMGGKEIGTCHNKIGQKMQAPAATADFRKGLSFEHKKKEFSKIPSKSFALKEFPKAAGPPRQDPQKHPQM